MLLAQIESTRQKYYEVIQGKKKVNTAKCAIVVFRSMEGLQRAKAAFEVGWFSRLRYWVCCCCVSRRLGQVLFKGRFLKVKKAVDPELLCWQNFGVSKKQRCLRTLIYIIFVILVLGVCFYSILFLQYTIDEAESLVPAGQCPQHVELTQASTDFQNSLD